MRLSTAPDRESERENAQCFVALPLSATTSPRRFWGGDEHGYTNFPTLEPAAA
jgi:hypothetical protein